LIAFATTLSMPSTAVIATRVVALPSVPLSPTGHECITLHARIDMRCTAREYPRTLPLGPSHMA
jgi:hypothetical protein